MRSTVLVALALTLLAASAFALPRFQSSHRSEHVGIYPYGAVVEDFDHDGRPDMAVLVSGYVTFGVALLQGTASGFTPVDTLPVSVSSLSIVAGLLDSDAHTDLVVASDNHVYVLIGNGDLTFQPAQSYGTYLGTDGQGLDLGDVTGDGLLDVVVSDSTNIVRVRPSISPGVLGPPSSLPIGGPAAGLEVLDLDGDDDQDIAVHHAGDLAGELTIFLNLGGGAFDTGTTYPGTPSYAFGIAAGDVDGDGDPDLIAAGSLFLGAGDGTFDAGTPLGDDTESWPLLVDLDADGRLDAVTLSVVTVLAPALVVVRNGNGDGTFQAPYSRYAPPGGGNLAAADADGDGRVDIVVGSSLIDMVSVSRGLGPPGLEPDAPELEMTGPPVDVAVGDATGDGVGDVLAVSSSPVSLRLFPGNGDLTFDVPLDLAPPVGVRAVAIGDFDDDGVPDLVTANGASGTVSQFRGTGGGSFAARTDHSANGTMTDVVVADVNGDGFDDAIAIGTSGVRLFPGQAGGGFAARIDRALGGSRLVVGRFNGDALPDVVGLSGSSIRTYFGQNVGGLSAGATTTIGNIGGETPYTLAALDLDDDDDDDLVTTAYISLGLRRVLNDGAGNWTVAPLITGGRRTESLAAGDVDGDGFPDLVAAGSLLACADLWMGAGDGTMVMDASFGVGGWVNAVALGDLDGDGYPELATADDHTYSEDGSPSALSVLRNSHSFVLDVPGATRRTPSRLAIERIWPTPARGAFQLALALSARGEATVELFDVGGRRLHRESLGVLEAGRQTRTLAIRAGIPPGLVWLRVRQGGESAVAKAIVAR